MNQHVALILCRGLGQLGLRVNAPEEKHIDYLVIDGSCC